jgi:hypothetical protein
MINRLWSGQHPVACHFGERPVDHAKREVLHHEERGKLSLACAYGCSGREQMTREARRPELFNKHFSPTRHRFEAKPLGDLAELLWEIVACLHVAHGARGSVRNDFNFMFASRHIARVVI